MTDTTAAPSCSQQTSVLTSCLLRGINPPPPPTSAPPPPTNTSADPVDDHHHRSLWRLYQDPRESHLTHRHHRDTSDHRTWGRIQYIHTCDKKTLTASSGATCLINTNVRCSNARFESQSFKIGSCDISFLPISDLLTLWIINPN